MTKLTKLTMLTAALMMSAAGAVLFSGGGLLGGSTDDDRQAAREAPTESAIDRQIGNLQARSTAHSDDAAALTELGYAYLQKARENGDPAFYTKAEGVFKQALALDANDTQVITGLGAVALARHDFEKALGFGLQAVSLDPSDADSHAVAGDALTELGRYDEAVAEFQQVVDLRPDLSAFVRIAYARELHGDIDGARAALDMAIEAGGPRGENAAYARLQLGHLLFNAGDLAAAETEYDQSLDAFPGYVHALAGLARVDAARGDYDETIRLYNQVTARQPVYDYVAALGDAYAAAGRSDEAKRQYALVDAIGRLYKANGVNTDLESAVFKADHSGDLAEAARQARSVLEAQPGSIRAADALAWTLHKSGRNAEALQYAHQAVRLNTRDNNILFHAAMIERAAGDPDRARDMLQQIANANPHFSLLHAAEASDALKELNPLAEAR